MRMGNKGNQGEHSTKKTSNGQGITGNEKGKTSYTRDGLTFVPVSEMRIVYHDAGKRDAPYSKYANGGFFANYKSESGVVFTLPVGNLCCDMPKIPAVSRKYLAPYVQSGKLRYDCSANASAQFHGKTPSTLVIPESGAPYVAELETILRCADGAARGRCGLPSICEAAGLGRKLYGPQLAPLDRHQKWKIVAHIWTDENAQLYLRHGDMEKTAK